jgi:hypothetical protein
MPRDYIELTFINNNSQFMPTWDALEVARTRQKKRRLFYYEPLHEARAPLTQNFVGNDIEFDAEYAHFLTVKGPDQEDEEVQESDLQGAMVHSDVEEEAETPEKHLVCTVCFDEAYVIIPKLNKLKCFKGHCMRNVCT